MELLMEVPVLSAAQGVRMKRQVVKAGAALARRTPGIPGQDGSTLLGQAVCAHRLREARLPGGAHTEVSADGCTLLAACDGEVVLRNLQVAVIPMVVHDGDVGPGTTLVQPGAALYIMGSVLERAHVEADGEIYVQGNVVEAGVQSRQANVCIQGTVSGSAQRPCPIQAAGNIAVDQARLAQLSATRNIYVLVRAWQCSLNAGQNLHLSGTVSSCLQDVQLEIGGGVYPIVQPDLPVEGRPRERQHLRVPCHLSAQIAVHTGASLSFKACTVLELSAGGTKCMSEDQDFDVAAGTVVQLKLALPGDDRPIILIARVARAIAPGWVGLRFEQITQRDAGRLATYCQMLVKKRPSALLTSPAQRRAHAAREATPASGAD